MVLLVALAICWILPWYPISVATQVSVFVKCNRMRTSMQKRACSGVARINKGNCSPGETLKRIWQSAKFICPELAFKSNGICLQRKGDSRWVYEMFQCFRMAIRTSSVRFS